MGRLEFLAMVIAMSRIRLKVVLKNLKPLLFIILLTAEIGRAHV